MKLLFALAALSLAGCANWKHPTASQADFNRDRYGCQMETANAYPTAQTSTGPGMQYPGRVNCSSYGNQTNCTTTPGTYVPAPTADSNALPRAFAFNSCMEARGYSR